MTHVLTALSTAGSALAATLRRNRLFLSLVLIYTFAAAAVGLFMGIPFWTRVPPVVLTILDILKLFLIIIGTGIIVWRFIHCLFRVKPDKPVRWLMSDLRSILRDVTHPVDGILCFMLIALMSASYAFFKDLIPVVNPFQWDTYFAALDRSLHGGADVWTLLWPLFGSPTATSAINVAYHAWFALIYLAVFAAAFDRRDPERGTVFLVAFALTWAVGGSLLATLFSSVGPVYYEAFGFGDTYAGQMERLKQLNEISPVWALELQQKLLEGYQSQSGMRGISAMPSMHVATSAVVALFGFSYSKALGWLLTAFTGVILIGSVHLGWHYAVDGYLSIGLAALFWWVAKILTRRFGATENYPQSASLAT
ncbi:MAG: phosphatase PAP2 family protein [Ruegeria sp.]|uniref:phosphatase PAP2 family protein n=1 Tax=Ruegeria sp. TaxID=1879320 RepID=UPI00349EB3DE